MTICIDDAMFASPRATRFGTLVAREHDGARAVFRRICVDHAFYPRNTVDLRRATPHLARRFDSRPWNDVTDPVLQLSDGQRDCLRLVYNHMTSKDIARALNISPHTVDMRLRTAMRALGVDNRIDAARLLIDSEGGADAYQPLIYQSSELGDTPESATIGAPASAMGEDHAVQHPDTRLSPDFGPSAAGPPRSAGAPSPLGARSAEQGHHGPLSQSLPWGARNTLSPGLRLAWIAGIAIGSSLAFGAIVGALEALKHLL